MAEAVYRGDKRSDLSESLKEGKRY
jgi:hypothetical protein